MLVKVCNGPSAVVYFGVMGKQSLIKDEVLHIAGLANLPLSDVEIDKFFIDLSLILDYFERLGEVPVSKDLDLSVTSEYKPREDQPVLSLNQEEALSNAKSVHNGLLEVEAIFKE